MYYVQHVKLILQLHLDIILVCFVRFFDFVLFVSWIQKSRQIPEGGKREQEFFGLKKDKTRKQRQEFFSTLENST